MSLDLKDAKIITDILEWGYTKLKPDEIDVIWASPPCTEYSKARTTGIRNIDYANRIVKKTLAIIRYLNCKYWFFENPQTGLLKNHNFMFGLPYFDVDYCKYGMKYRKRTRIWTNDVKSWKPQPLCKKDCESIVSGRHIETAQRGSSKSHINNKHTQNDLYVIPSKLITEIFLSLEF